MITDDLSIAPDLQRLGTWLERELARGATRIELRRYSNSSIESWEALTGDSTKLTDAVIQKARYHLHQAARLGMIGSAADEQRRANQVDVACEFLVVAFSGATYSATIRLRIEPIAPVDVLRLALCRLGMYAQHPPSAAERPLLERFVCMFGAYNDRLDRICDLLSPAEVRAVDELSRCTAEEHRLGPIVPGPCHDACRAPCHGAEREQP